MSLLTSLLLLIVSCRLLGKLFERFGQPGLVGEVIAGILVGPSVFGLVKPTEALSGISELAVFLVVLSAGLEMNFKDLAGVLTRGKGLLIAVLGFLIPFAGGILVGIVFQLDVMRTVFLALCVSITALPVAVRILENFKLLDTEIARLSVATAIVNDVIALLALGVILDLPSQKSFQAIAISIGITGGKLVLLAFVIIGFNAVLERLHRQGLPLHRIPERLVSFFGGEGLFGIVVAFVLVFGSISDALGFHFVIGAFFGALLIDKKFFLASRYQDLERTLGSITGGFLAPVFFGYLGISFEAASMTSAPFVVAVLLVSVASKVLAGWIGGKIAGLPRHEALGLGFILNGRGIMELVVASIAFQRGFIGQGLYSTLVLMGLVTTLLTTLLFGRIVVPRMARRRAARA